MRKLKALLFLFVFFVVCQSQSPAQNTIINRLRDVKTIYLDETSFNFRSSSCMKTYGNLKVVCAKHLADREAFLVALKRWIGKYKLVLIGDKSKADAILQGDLSIDDESTLRDYQESTRRREKNKKPDPNESPSLFPGDLLPGEPLWAVRGWLVNQYGEKLWTSPDEDLPGISYASGKHSKIEGKRLAKKLQYGFKKSK